MMFSSFKYDYKYFFAYFISYANFEIYILLILKKEKVISSEITLILLN